MIIPTACVGVRNKEDNAYMLARIMEMLPEQGWWRPKQETCSPVKNEPQLSNQRFWVWNRDSPGVTIIWIIQWEKCFHSSSQGLTGEMNNGIQPLGALNYIPELF